MAKKVTEAAAKAATEEWLNADVELQATQAEKRKTLTPIISVYEKAERELTDRKMQAAAVIEQYAEQHRDELLSDGKKSTAYCGATIGWKKSPASLQLADGKSWDDVMDALEEYFPDFVIEKREVDKAGILRNQEVIADQLEAIGVTVEQKETFFVKAN